MKWYQRQAEERAARKREINQFLKSVLTLKERLLHQKAKHLCHFKERRRIRERKHLRKLERIKKSYRIDDMLPFESPLFKKLINCDHKRTKQKMEQHWRMTRIIENLCKELICDFKDMRKPPISEGLSRESFEAEEQEESKRDFSDEIEGEYGKEKQKVSELAGNENKSLEDKSNSDDQSKSGADACESAESTVQYKKTMFYDVPIISDLPKDTCFYAKPSEVVINDFEVGKEYSQKIMVINKSSKCAYLRFDRIDVDTDQPNIFQMEALEAARVKPGLHVTATIKFSPEADERATGNIRFLTLLAGVSQTFHELFIPIRCTPKMPLPIVEPKEIKYAPAPIWKFNSSRLSDKILTISNAGGKSFSFCLAERDSRKDCFLWEPIDASVLSPDCVSIDPEAEDSTVNERKKYELEVPPKHKFRLRITFQPRYVGLHHEVLQLSFLIDGYVFFKETIPLWAEATGSPIRVDPQCIDFGIVTIGLGAHHQNFELLNTSQSSIEIFIRTPKRLGHQVSVYPKSFILQSNEYRKIVVKLVPERNIIEVSKGYYDPLSSMLEFVIQIETRGLLSDAPPLSLKALAGLSSCHPLILKPPSIDLGQVFTNESICAELKLTNASLAAHDYGFLDLPESAEVQPNYGFGRILPGETLALRLIYSARVSDIPRNDVGAQIPDQTRFRIQVTTLSELAVSKNHAELHTMHNSTDVVAYVTDTLCEFSEQIIELPATPCGSFVVTSIDLRGFNTSSEWTCSCGLVKNQATKFTARYEFRASSRQLRITPQTGTLRTDGSRKVTLIFQPVLSEPAILEEAQKLQNEANALKIAEPETPTETGKKAKRKQRIKDAGPKKVNSEIGDALLSQAELNLLENFAPRIDTIFVTCEIVVDLESGDERNEILLAKLTCPVIKPDIVVLNTKREIDFEGVACETSSTQFLRIKNISDCAVQITSTPLDPHGPFFMGATGSIEPGSTLNIPITFRPMDDTKQQITESFEVAADKSKTLWTVKVSGYGIPQRVTSAKKSTPKKSSPKRT